MSNYGIVIVGAGEAGARAAIEARVQGWQGAITLIGKETFVPYERPPLSKATLLATDEPSPPYIFVKEKLLENNIQFMGGCMVTKINRANHEIVLADGRELGYERLLLATGASPRRLSLDGADADNVLYLRTFYDALNLRSRMNPGKHFVIIGAGFIGLEVAASAIQRNCSVTVVEVGPRILMRGVPREIADVIEARHRTAGVEFKLGIGVERIDRDGDSSSVMLTDGTSVSCDFIAVGIGAVPETSLAGESGLEIENGVRVDEMLQTSDPDIFAVGDCCSFPHPLYEGKRIRLEAWRNAQDQGMHVAQNLLGASEPFTTVPWFWSDQYEQTLQVAGLTDCGENTVKRELGEAGTVYFHLSQSGRLMAASGVGPSTSLAKEIRIAEMLIQQQATIAPKALADPTFRLKALLRA